MGNKNGTEPKRPNPQNKSDEELDDEFDQLVKQYHMALKVADEAPNEIVEKIMPFVEKNLHNRQELMNLLQVHATDMDPSLALGTVEIGKLEASMRKPYKKLQRKMDNNQIEQEQGKSKRELLDIYQVLCDIENEIITWPTKANSWGVSPSEAEKNAGIRYLFAKVVDELDKKIFV